MKSIGSAKKGYAVVIDDDESMRLLFEQYLKEKGYEVLSFSSPARALMSFKQNKWDADIGQDDISFVFCDILMPEIGGLELVDALKKVSPDVPLIMITADESLQTAVKALRAGAFDYLTKPIKPTELDAAIERALKLRGLHRENNTLRAEVKRSWAYTSIIGKSPSMKAIFNLIQKVGPTQANVLIHGESGTGKEVVARALHHASSRADKPFVAINCSAIPESLLESELFGHAKGSFTGATANRQGLFEEAEGGTLFLDEIGDMELGLQAKLLRVLQERKIKPVGDNKYRDIDVRIIAATHKDLNTAIKAREFREDLFYRLNVIPIVIPPLRDRQEDIPLLAEHFLARSVASHHTSNKELSRRALAHLISYAWPGNVRELENTLERAVILSESESIEENDIQFASTHATEPTNIFKELSGVGGYLSLDELEAKYIRFVLEKTGATKEQAAQILGIDRKTLYRKEKEMGLIGGGAPEPGLNPFEGNA